MDPAPPAASDGSAPGPVSATVTTRRRTAVVLGVVAVGLLVVVVGALAVTRPGGTTGTGAIPHFVDEATAAGLDHVYDGDFAYAVGGGVATFDCDGDGRPELYLAGGGNPAALFHNDSPVGGALRFSPVHDPATDLTGVEGAYPLDVDGDGQVDLAVLRAGESVLLRGLGDCRFERANEAWSFDGGDGMATAFSATWEGAATLPTLAVGEYLKLDATGDTTLDCSDDSRLYRPAAGGAGYATPIALRPGYCALSMLFSDWDRSGRRDLRVSNDRHYYDRDVGQEQLWRMTPSRAAAAVHEGRRLDGGPGRGDGHRLVRRDRRWLPRGLPDEPGRQPAAGPRVRPGAADLHGHRTSARRQRRRAVHRWRRPALDRLARRSSRTSTTTASSTCSSRRAMSPNSPTTR